MRTSIRLLAVLALTGLLLVTLAGPTFAQISPTACWNNCGTVSH